MKHNYKLDGFGYRLRPIKLSDAQFVIDTRLEDMERNKFVHPISRDINVQEEWLKTYFKREGDYYFIIENRFTGESEGLISFYDEQDGKAEWGRWVVKKGSLSAPESVYLLYRIAFEQVGLNELYCRTISDNINVVSFHTSIGEKLRVVHEKLFELNGNMYDATEQYSDKEHFYNNIAPMLEKRSKMVADRNFKRLVGSFEFHHIGVATKSIEKEFDSYSLMGYKKEDMVFEDKEQGIKGQFIVNNQMPRLELLENLEGYHTLDKQLEKNQKLYHTAYYVDNIDKAIEIFKLNRAKIISPLKQSVYFGKRICFLMLPNMDMIELLER